MQVAARGNGAQVLVVNKFGKLEAAGRGYVPLIVQALEAGVDYTLVIYGSAASPISARVSG